MKCTFLCISSNAGRADAPYLGLAWYASCGWRLWLVGPLVLAFVKVDKGPVDYPISAGGRVVPGEIPVP